MQTKPIQVNDVKLATSRINVRGMLSRDRWNNSRAVSQPGRAEDHPHVSEDLLIESAAIEWGGGAVEEDTRAFSTPLSNALKVAIGIFGVYVVAASVLAIVVFTPGLKLLGFFVSLSMMTAVGMPMLLATISVAAEDATSASLQRAIEPGSTIRGARLGGPGEAS